MKYLGYIVSKTPIKTKFDFIKNVDDINLVEQGKPFLIIGYKEAKNIFGDSFSILNKSVGEGKFWTFSRLEKREEFENDIVIFYNYIINNILNNIKYIYLNLLNINLNILKRLIYFINNINIKYISIHKDMVYIQCNETTVVGFSLTIAEYCGINKNKIIQRIKNNPNNNVCEDLECLSYKLKHRISNKLYAAPMFLYLLNE